MKNIIENGSELQSSGLDPNAHDSQMKASDVDNARQSTIIRYVCGPYHHSNCTPSTHQCIQPCPTWEKLEFGPQACTQGCSRLLRATAKAATLPNFQSVAHTSKSQRMGLVLMVI